MTVIVRFSYYSEVTVRRGSTGLGSVHHGTGHYMLHGLSNDTITGFWFVAYPHLRLLTLTD